MSTPGDASQPPGHDEALEALEEYLRRKRLKMTEQRRTMLRLALSHAHHFTAVDVLTRLRDVGEPVSLATIYRALNLFEDAGILEGHDFADGQRRYERALTREHHDHLICLDCRAVVEFRNAAIEDLQERVLDEHGFKMVHHALTIFASCRELHDRGACARRDADRKRVAEQRRGGRST